MLPIDLILRLVRTTTWCPIAWILWLAAMHSPMLATADQKQLQQQQLQQLQVKLQQLKRELASQTDAEHIGAQELEQLERKMASLDREMAHNAKVILELSKRLVQLQQRETMLLSQQHELQAQLGALVRTAYMMGRQPSLKLILNQHDPNEIARAMSIFTYLSDSRLSKIKALQVLQLELTNTQIDLQQGRSKLELITPKLAQAKQEIETLGQQRRQQLAAVRTQRQATGKQYQAARQRETTLRRLIETIAKVRQPAPRRRKPDATPPPPATKPAPSYQLAFRQNKGRMGLPVKGRLIARYGDRRQESGVKWQGLLIGSRDGARVNSIYQGQVIFADWFRGFGQLVVLDHGSGYMSLYGHNKLLHTRPGDIVEGGQQIATVGSTGGLETSALYFEIRYNGEPDDPLQWCKI